jgi:hypothetical protein
MAVMMAEESRSVAVPDCVLTLVATKADLPLKQRIVAPAQGRAAAARIGRVEWAECSALTGSGVVPLIARTYVRCWRAEELRREAARLKEEEAARAKAALAAEEAARAKACCTVQ